MFSARTNNTLPSDVNGVAQVNGVSSNDFASPVTYRVYADDGSFVDYSVEVDRAPANGKRILYFWVVGVGGTVDEGAHTIQLTLPARSDVRAAAASFSITGVSLAVDGLEQASGVTANDFNQPVPYSVWADDGTVRAYLVTAVRNSEIPGMWNFDFVDGEGCTVSGAQVVPALEGNGLRFDGVDDYMLVPDGDVLGFGGPGSLVSSLPSTIGPVRDSNGGLVIGARLADQHYNSAYRNLCLDGTIGRVVVYERALGADEVQDLYLYMD